MAAPIDVSKDIDADVLQPEEQPQEIIEAPPSKRARVSTKPLSSEFIYDTKLMYTKYAQRETPAAKDR